MLSSVTHQSMVIHGHTLTDENALANAFSSEHGHTLRGLLLANAFSSVNVTNQTST